MEMLVPFVVVVIGLVIAGGMVGMLIARPLDRITRPRLDEGAVPDPAAPATTDGPTPLQEIDR